MKFGSFDKAIANSKFSYSEKYHKASMEDLNVYKNVLDAQVIMGERGVVTIVLPSGYSINVTIGHSE